MKRKHGEQICSFYFPVEVIDSLEACMQCFRCPAYTASATSLSPQEGTSKQKKNPTLIKQTTKCEKSVLNYSIFEVIASRCHLSSVRVVSCLIVFWESGSVMPIDFLSFSLKDHKSSANMRKKIFFINLFFSFLTVCPCNIRHVQP